MSDKTKKEAENEQARKEVESGNTHYIGDTIEDFEKWADKQ
ncbi:hypothetical protein ACQW5G_04195 [Fructilactobacillus sp. Tb1]